MRYIWVASIALLLNFAGPASAASLTIKLTNRSGDTISQLTAVQKLSPDFKEKSTHTAPAAKGTSAVMTVEQADAELATSLQVAIDVSLQSILEKPIANGEAGVAALEAAEGDCVFNLTFTFASGKILERPDTDLCQSDGIVIE